MASERGVATVRTTRAIAPAVREIVFESPLAAASFAPGADVTLQIPHQGSTLPRRYSIWRSGPFWFALRVTLHGRGPAGRWAASCAAGDAIAIERTDTLPLSLDASAETHRLFGDETFTATADLFAITLPPATDLRIWLEAPDDRRWPTVELCRPEAVRWVDREGRPGAALLARIDAGELDPPPHAAVYVAGEAWLCASVCRALVRGRGVPPDRVRSLPYWKERPTPQDAR
jgi:NADPH-dependent ferric siderophore reductase